jgi:hypothetical protein
MLLILNHVNGISRMCPSGGTHCDLARGMFLVLADLLHHA